MATSPLSTTAVETLTSRTKATMRGEDPVIKLLDNRMKEVFRGMVVWNPQTAQATTNHIPVQMKTGRSILGVIGENSGGSDVFRTQFLKEAQREFTRKGFSIYASDLSQTCLMATKVIHLMCLLYGEIFISKMILMACSDWFKKKGWIQMQFGCVMIHAKWKIFGCLDFHQKKSGHFNYFIFCMLVSWR